MAILYRTTKSDNIFQWGFLAQLPNLIPVNTSGYMLKFKSLHVLSLYFTLIFSLGQREVEGMSSVDAHSPAILPPSSSLLCNHSNWVFLSTLSGIQWQHHRPFIIIIRIFPGFSAEISNTSGSLLHHCGTGAVQWLHFPSEKTGWFMQCDRCITMHKMMFMNVLIFFFLNNWVHVHVVVSWWPLWHCQQYWVFHFTRGDL